MSRYQRGAAFERNLVTGFWHHGWAAVRAAGSGTRREPVPDVIAVKGGECIIIECKTTKKERISLKSAILQLKEFADASGARSYLAIRFFRKKPRFYNIKGLIKRKNYTIGESDDYESFETVIGEQKTL
jgi:Holliday junction resolvase